MMEADRRKWNERYAGAGFLLGTGPSAFLAESIDLLKSRCPGRRALDIACGEGRNSIFLAQSGFLVTGLDISEQGLAKARRRARSEGLTIRFRRTDLEKRTFAGPFDLIVNINFLLRGLFPVMVEALSPGGIVLVETLLDGPLAPPTTNRSFLLQQGELEQLFCSLPGSILHASESPQASSPSARLIFQKEG